MLFSQRQACILKDFVVWWKLAIHRGRTSAKFRSREDLLSVYDVNNYSIDIHMGGANKTSGDRYKYLKISLNSTA